MDTENRMASPGDAAVYDMARHHVEHAVHGLLVDVLGPEALAQRPVWPGARTTSMQPSSDLAAIAAAHRIRNVANALLVQYTQQARGGGVSWEEIADGLGVTVDEAIDVPHGIAAFEHVATTNLWGEPCFPWRCGTCHRLVVDFGPYTGDPDEDERGHAEGCARRRDPEGGGR